MSKIVNSHLIEEFKDVVSEEDELEQRDMSMLKALSGFSASQNDIFVALKKVIDS